MRAVQLKSFFYSCFTVILLLATLMLFQGCGEGNFANNNPGTQTDSLNSLASVGDKGTLVREHWRTDSETLLDGISVTYSPIDGPGGTRNRLGLSDSISVKLSLVESENGILAYGSVILDEQTSITRHPLEIVFKELPFEADEDGIILTLDSTVCEVCTLTTKTESGTLIQPDFTLTMEITESPQNGYTCHCTIEIKSLYTVGEFTLPIERKGSNDPLAFIESTWGKKNRFFTISCPRKYYSEQSQAKAQADRDLFKLNISETESETLTGSEFYLPASLSPNGAAITIDLSDTRILSSLLNNVVIEKRGTVDTVDMDGDGVSTAYRLSLNLTKKYVMEDQDRSLCVSNCKDRCTRDYSGDQRQTCLENCENSSCVVKAERYTLTASLELDGLNTRTTLVETVKRNDGVDPDAAEESVHDDFYGGQFLLPKDETYSVTHAVSKGEITDVARVSYDMILLEMNVMDDGTKGLVTGQVRIPKDVYPDRGPYTFIDPYTTISLGTTAVNLETFSLASDFSSLEIGTAASSGWVPTTINKSYMADQGELSIEEQGFLHLSVSTLENGARQCRVDYAGADPWTRISITGMEVTIKEPPAEGNPEVTFNPVQSPRQVVFCRDAVNNLFESDVNVSLTLCKRWKNGVESIGVKDGRLSIGHDMDCTGSLSEDLPVDAVVDMGEDGFTLVAALQDITREPMADALILNLVKLAEDDFEFQVYLLAGDNRSEELSFYLPAQRVTGTGVFISSAR